VHLPEGEKFRLDGAGGPAHGDAQVNDIEEDFLLVLPDLRPRLPVEERVASPHPGVRQPLLPGGAVRLRGTLSKGLQQ
jgi:hypothetical protein